jgi:uncharacterized MnhB-related membrane protein
VTTVLPVLALLLVAATGTATVLARDPAGQAVTLSAYGLVLTVLFVVLQAPDVALSQLAVGTVVVPLMILLTILKIRGRQ